MIELVAALKKILPTYTLPAPADATAPYAVFSASESVVRTKSGIAGYEGTINLSIYAPNMLILERVTTQVVAALDEKTLDGKTMYIADIDVTDYPDVGLMAKELTINTLR